MSLKNPRLSEQAAQEKDTDFWRVYNTVRDMAEKHRCRATDKMKEWEFMTFLCEIYRAGYADGKEGTEKQQNTCTMHLQSDLNYIISRNNERFARKVLVFAREMERVWRG